MAADRLSHGRLGLPMATLQINTRAYFNEKPLIAQWASKSMSPLSACTGRLSGEDDSMIENCRPLFK